MFAVKLILRDGTEKVVTPPMDNEHETADRFRLTLAACHDVALAEVIRLPIADPDSPKPAA